MPRVRTGRAGNAYALREDDARESKFVDAVLGKEAERIWGRRYAEALHYKELEYRTPELARDRHAAAEQLIAINRKLGRPEAARGVLHATRRRAERRRRTKHLAVGAARRGEAPLGRTTDEPPSPRVVPPRAAVAGDVSESWLGKLGSYDEALRRYRRRLDLDAGDGEAILGALKCLDALGAWREACDLLVGSWHALRASSDDAAAGLYPSSSLSLASGNNLEALSAASSNPAPSPRRTNISATPERAPTPSARVPRLLMKAANVGARAAWALGRWAEMRDFVDAMEDDDAGKPFYRAVLALRPGAAADPGRAVELVDEARRLLHPAFAALVGESYKRAYGTMVAARDPSGLVCPFRKTPPP